MIEEDLAEIPSLRKMISKYKLAAKSDMATELLPPRKAGDQRRFNGLNTQSGK
jgi:hypothetical protein